ncbi:lipid-A-disaccharide synthase N-terminal domain-containing protein [Candidatus Gottesmanbacteria bacterium]|nr:lipid-A-disaccharide synthase N-terminal domain-containing protein [Candidatus Gottesmanbacteria bacterium]
MNITFDGWVIFGFLAQFIFFLRFAVQWWASEKEKKSVIPISFWYLSIVGSVMILVYAIKREDIVFITAQFLALFIYVRNIMLRKKENTDL